MKVKAISELLLLILTLSGEIENWWEPKTEESFKEKAQCIIDLYGNFTDTQVGLNLNGIANQGENIADIGGLKEAYKGYCEYSSGLMCKILILV